MHRTFPRFIGWWSLLSLLALHVGIQAASAQNPLPPGLNAPALPNNQHAQQVDLPLGASRICQMTTRADLKRVENPNSRVVRVERIPNRNNEILLVAENPGRSLITFVDQNDRVEVHEIVVAFQGAADAKKMILPWDSQRTITLDKAPLGGSHISIGGIVDVKQAPDNVKVFTIKALAAGTTRITWYADKGKTEIVASYDIEVPSQDRVTQLRELIKKVAPAAAVEVTPLSTKDDARPADQDGKKGEVLSIILTGTATSAFEAKTIFDAARRLFPPTVLGLSAQPVGGGVAQQNQFQENVINQLRIGGVHQVQLEVVVAVVNRSMARNMTFSWNVTGSNWFVSSLIGGSGGLTSVLTPFAPANTTTSLTPTGTQNVAFGVLNGNSSVLGFLQMLRTEGLTKILAEPRVTTLSGRSASILSGGQTPIVLATGVGAPPSVTYKDFGTQVNFLPIVLGNGKIHLEVSPQLSQIDPAAGISVTGVTAPGFRTRSAQVAVQIEDGQTLAIGGLIQNTVTGQIARVPVLGDLPYLGTLFTSKSFTETEEELIILVTPRLVDPVDCTKIPRWLPGRETRSPSDFEFFLEGIQEAPRGQRNVVFHPHLYKAAYHNAPNAGQVPCGDGSSYNRGGCASGNCAPSGVYPSSASMVRPEINSMPSVSMPSAMPSFPETQAVPASRIILEPEQPSLPPSSSGLGSPMSSRQQDARPVLPPLNGPNR